ncbi:MAG: cytochrome c, partial [Deinococcus sp.]|nr:cytochrome c [Deinococcus sp.]
MQFRHVVRQRWAKEGLAALLVLGWLITGMVYVVSTAPPAHAQSAAGGQAIFEQKCAACHTIGGGTKVGPDLQGVTTYRTQDWLVRWISAPDQVLAAGDPIATQLLQQFNNIPMPNMGLTPDEVTALIGYLSTQTGGTTAPPEPAPAPALAPGDPVLGKALFNGVIRLQNGGPP